MKAVNVSAEKDGLRVVVYPGDNKILIAMSLDDSAIGENNNLAGFAIWRKYQGKDEEVLVNRISFTNGVDKTTTAATPANKVAAGDKIGVPECDDFIAKYDACVSSKVPEAARAQYKSAVDQWRASWKKLAENPATKGSLAAACKQAAAQQEAALKSYGCSW